MNQIKPVKMSGTKAWAILGIVAVGVYWGSLSGESEYQSEWLELSPEERNELRSSRMKTVKNGEFRDQDYSGFRKESTPTSAFEVVKPGVVLHKATNLMWMQCSVGQTYENGQCSGYPARFVWSDTTSWKGKRRVKLEESVNNGVAPRDGMSVVDTYGYDDWFVPNLTQLLSISEKAANTPSINLEVFPNTPGSRQFDTPKGARGVKELNYLTRNLVSGMVKSVDFEIGGMHDAVDGYVRLVRRVQEKSTGKLDKNSKYLTQAL